MSAKVVVTKEHLQRIGEAIIAKGGADAPMKPGEMAAKIAAIPSGGENPWDAFWAGWRAGNLEEVDFIELARDDAILISNIFTASITLLNPIAATIKRFVGPNAVISGSAFANCRVLEYVKISNLTNAASPWPTLPNHKITTIVSAFQTAQTILTNCANIFSRMREDCKIYGNDGKHIEYVAGAWTVVEGGEP